ncbi:MAG: ABC transporter substrate-binding protein [Lachnospiraceae bacterium]|nr:ABC transporter substrate-binding protein [Lachnospiraceae bacterium]
MKKAFIRICSLVLVLAMVFSLCACSNADGGNETAGDGKDASASTFKIGISTILSGAGALYGEEAIDGVELALEYINANGGFNGVQGEYVVYDEQGKAEEAVKIAQKFIQTDKVNAVIASNSSSLALAACPYYEEAGVVTLPMGNSPAFTQQGWKYVYHAVMNNDFTTPIVEDLLVQMGFKTVAVAKSQDDNGLNSAKLFIDACKEDNIEVLTEEAFATTDTDFSGQCARIVSANPECVFMSVSGDANGTFIKQLRSFGYTGLVFSKESMTNSMIDIAGEDTAKYVIFANPYVVYETIEDCDIDIVHAFLESYIAKCGNINATDVCYRAYDCVMTIWEATKIAGSNDAEAIAQAMDKVKFEGLGGTIDFAVGDHEGYHSFNSFIEINRKNLDFQSWYENGGYDEYKTATGNAK